MEDQEKWVKNYKKRMDVLRVPETLRERTLEKMKEEMAKDKKEKDKA